MRINSKPNKKINIDSLELRPKKQASTLGCKLFRRYVAKES